MIQPYSEGKAILPLSVPASWVGRLNALALKHATNRSKLIRMTLTQAFPELLDAQSPEKQTSTSNHTSTKK